MFFNSSTALINSIEELRVCQNETKCFRCHFTHHLLAPDSYELYGVLPSKGILKAARKRQSEFIAGRFCAQLGLKELGVKGRVIGYGEDRVPLWPNGTARSLIIPSKTNNYKVKRNMISRNKKPRIARLVFVEIKGIIVVCSLFIQLYFNFLSSFLCFTFQSCSFSQLNKGIPFANKFIIFIRKKNI